MKIICEKYTWLSSVPTEEVNFNSTATRTLAATIYLHHNLVKGSMSNIEYSAETINQTSNTLSISAGNVSFQLDNLILVYYNPFGDGESLTTFFEVYTPNDFVKWKIYFLEDDDTKLFSAIINKDGVTLNDVKKNILNILAVGYEKEFSDYYNNKELIPATDIPTTVLPTGVNYTGQSWYSLQSVLHSNFPSVTNNLFSGDYYMAMRPYTFSPQTQFYTQPLMHFRTGYEPFALDYATRFNYFNSLNMAMGWIWYFHNEQLTIQERGNNDYDILEIDYKDFITHSITNSLTEFAIDNVIIKDGEYFDNGTVGQGGDNISLWSVADHSRPLFKSTNLSGHCDKMYSPYVYTNKTRIFKNIYLWQPNTYRTDYSLWDFNQTSDHEEQLNYFYPYERTYTSVGAPYTLTKVPYTYVQKKTLILNPVINSNRHSGGIDGNNARANPPGMYYGNGNFYRLEYTLTPSMGCYNGNPAGALFKWDSVIEKYIDYDTYCHSDNFVKNFIGFLSNRNNVFMDVEINQFITNPKLRIKIINYPFGNISGKLFVISNLKFHPITRKSILKLQMI